MLFYPPRSDALFSNYFEDLLFYQTVEPLRTRVVIFGTSVHWSSSPMVLLNLQGAIS